MAAWSSFLSASAAASTSPGVRVVSVRAPAAVATAGELRRDDLGHGRHAVEDVLAADRDAAEAVVMRPSYEPHRSRSATRVFHAGMAGAIERRHRSAGSIFGTQVPGGR